MDAAGSDEVRKLPRDLVALSANRACVGQVIQLVAVRAAVHEHPLLSDRRARMPSGQQPSCHGQAERNRSEYDSDQRQPRSVRLSRAIRARTRMLRQSGSPEPQGSATIPQATIAHGNATSTAVLMTIPTTVLGT